MRPARESGYLAARLLAGPGLAEARAVELDHLVGGDDDPVWVRAGRGFGFRARKSRGEIARRDTGSKRRFERPLVDAGGHGLDRDTGPFEERSSHLARRGEDERRIRTPDTRTRHLRRQ
jgi:hypothetical protein